MKICNNFFTITYYPRPNDILQELEQLNLESSMAPETVPSVSDPVPTSDTSKSLEKHVCDDEDTKKRGMKGERTRYNTCFNDYCVNILILLQ